MNVSRQLIRRLPLWLALIIVATATDSMAEEAGHLSRPFLGGMPGLPVITGISRETNGLKLTWDGPSGNYQLYQKAMVTDVWQAIGKPANQLRAATVTAPLSASLFTITGPAPHYAGSRGCIECHGPTVNTVNHTAHAGAFTNGLFVALGGQTDASCLPCHTVGFGVPTGFLNNSLTPHLANVQCESCHGPAAWHAANPEDPVTRPRVDISSAVCGGCHNGTVPARVAQYHPPRFEEWAASPHAEVVEEVQTLFEGPLGPSVYISNCGTCHSGTVRDALTEGRALPGGHEASAIGIACATCHDPHQQYVHHNALNGLQKNTRTGFTINNTQLGSTYTNQIPYPLASLVDYHTSGKFATNFNAEINLCAQCHNDRGATAKAVDRPPHHSAQYNMLLGTFRQEDTTVPSNQPATHAFLEKQCVSCHMQTPAGSSGHTFKVTTFDVCNNCHRNGAGLVQFTTNAIISEIQRNKSALDFWATTKAPPALKKYGARAWEYVNPGDLSGAGLAPTAAEQSLIPAGIQKARFIVYLVFNEGSFGIHNGPYTSELLAAAYGLIQDEVVK
jgi:hypothetical protein